jgi:DNA-binding NarL/FixJ family response regulator
MLRILVADDHAVVRSGLRLSLEAHPEWEVCAEAANGRQAVDRAREVRPDIAILDLMMPELSGLEAIRLIRHEIPDTEVLVFTFQQSEEMAAEALVAGARGYILKTDPPEDLVSAVDSLSRHTPFFTRSVAETVVHRILKGRAIRGGMLSLLTARERQVVQMVAEGGRTRDVAGALGITAKTVETHRTAIMRKLQLRSVADLVRWAVRNNVVQP